MEDLFKPFKTIQLISKSSYSSVYRVDNSVLKLISPTFQEHERRMHRMLMDYDLTPLIIEDGTININGKIYGYIITPFVSPILKDVMENESVNIEQITIQLKQLLSLLHELNIVHGDLNYTNIYLENGKMKLLDFQTTRLEGNSVFDKWVLIQDLRFVNISPEWKEYIKTSLN